mgnify:CR=1 FL=1
MWARTTGRRLHRRRVRLVFLQQVTDEHAVLRSAGQSSQRPSVYSDRHRSSGDERIDEAMLIDNNDNEVLEFLLQQR